MGINLDYKEYDENILKHLHNVQLMILKDFVDICEENNLDYCVHAGTALGAIRHNGFIPWDDDVDVIMFRKDYDKFLKIMDSKKSDKYELLTMNNGDYFFMFSKLSLKGTKFEEIWTTETAFDIGINIDIFVFDNIPNNKFKRFFYIKWCKYALKNLSFILMVITNDVYISKNKEMLGKCIKLFFKIFHITPQWFKKRYRNTVLKYLNENCDSVYDINAETYTAVFSKDIFKPFKKVKFESIEVNVPNDYDSFLKSIYGDYMKLPPVEERSNHAHNFIDFGDY